MNQFTSGKDEYPTDPTSAQSGLELYRTPLDAPINSRAPNNSDTTSVDTQPTVDLMEQSSGLTFAQGSTSVIGTNGVSHEGVTCFRCNGTGH